MSTQESILGQLALATHDTAMEPETPMWDGDWYAAREVRAEEHRARVAAGNEAHRAYWAAFAQSSREDYHRAYADLYGMEAILDTNWTNSYTSYRGLSFALNHRVNVKEGRQHTHRVPKTIEQEPFLDTLNVETPLAQCQAIMVVLQLAAAGWVGTFLAEPATIPSWRIRKTSQGLVCPRLAHRLRQRPSVVEYVEVTEDVPAEWEQPYTVEGALRLLKTAEGAGFSQEGTEGVTVLIDSTQRMHVVHFITKRQPFWCQSKRTPGLYLNPNDYGPPSKVPLEVHSLDLQATAEDALREMAAVASAMESTAPEQDNGMLPWMAAAVAAEAAMQTSEPDITGSHEWLALVSDQRQTGTVYRSRGAGPDA